MDWPALAAAIGGPVVGIVAIGRSRSEGRESRQQTLTLAQEQHEHERSLRRSERLFDRRAGVYEDVLKTIVRSIVTIDRTHPMIGPAPDPPPPLTDDEWMTLEARIAAFGSRKVLDALSEFSQRAREFPVRALTWYTMAGQTGQASQVAEAHEAMEAARAQAREQSVTLQDVVRDELTNL